mmetsp:Transcript_1435/g.3238  ORF Transcript_1435/g.3238 Transcript_1435/m.3238 type:complete len:245 (+) Transcript_1435:48-782(+)|eukprot:CAMPEP_0201173562 /NCGR_PEP_ID=MMETSP0851-20130426/95630_1 /ASSEMBLY_ACC=CAM_ASM_000631 /TAXON_ID=183588 /ORGANISM="Pseudo-nitzschia fraudulenta, Strain WWA7" /LENGTH=244 /DNA_ID=CAMNT_0047456321 /DNA_START=50 /DNA_END=784 /DNA_ORIENTATION=-
MVYANLLRRTSSQLVSQRRSLLFSVPTAAPISTPALTQAPTTGSIGSIRTVASVATGTSVPTIQAPLFAGINYKNNNNNTTRSKHSSRQIKRLFKKNPARRRIALKNNDENYTDEGNVPEATIEPIVAEPKIFSNGWNPPLGDDGAELRKYPFAVARTKNKPNNAVGFLPVYSEYRKDGARITTRIKKVSGDRDKFLNELRASLQIPIPKNPREDTIRVRTGGTIEIKGNRVLEVKTWLAGLGF